MAFKDEETKRAWFRKHYNENKQQYKDYAKALRYQILDWLDEIKASRGCNNCPEKDPACLDFHHRDPKAKVIQVSEAARKKWKKERILEEVAKCAVTCANCHRKHHSRKK